MTGSQALGAGLLAFAWGVVAGWFLRSAARKQPQGVLEHEALRLEVAELERRIRIGFLNAGVLEWAKGAKFALVWAMGVRGAWPPQNALRQAEPEYPPIPERNRSALPPA